MISTILVVTLFLLHSDAAPPEALGEQLRQAAREGDVDRVNALLQTGVDVNAASRYRLTALYYAADRGHAEVVASLLKAGATYEIPDEPYYRLSPMIMAARKNHVAVVRLLLDAGAEIGAWTAQWPAYNGHSEVVELLVERKPDIFDQTQLNQLAGIAKQTGNDRLLEFLLARGAEPPTTAEVEAEFAVLSTRQMQLIDGKYDHVDSSDSTRVWFRKQKLYVGNEFELATELRQCDDLEFEYVETPALRVRFGQPLGSRLKIYDQSESENAKTDSISIFKRRVATVPEDGKTGGISEVASGKGNWPRFRGEQGAGCADNWDLPDDFDAITGRGLAWKIAVPGVGHSSPVIWGNRIVVTSANPINSEPVYDLRVASGFDTHTEDIEFEWSVSCFDLRSGKLRWQRILAKGIPKAQRHIMSSHANCTPAIDGQRIIVNLAGEGLFCLDHEGETLWKRSLGRLAAGWFMDPGYEWGYASSPVLHKDRLLVQCDIFSGSFLAAFDADNGNELWRVARDEISGWGTPLVMNTAQGSQVITNGTRSVCGYDLNSGDRLWHIDTNSAITVASPIPNGDAAIVTGGYAPVQPIYNVDLGARGRIEPDESQKKEPGTAPGLMWFQMNGGAYAITPIVYQGRLFLLMSNGVMSCRNAQTGELLFRQRVAAGRGSDIAASPIAADGKLYIADTHGDVFVLNAGDEYSRPRACPIGEPIMATPAAAPGRLVVRGKHHLFCFVKEQ